jgi:hypothetical protein
VVAAVFGWALGTRRPLAAFGITDTVEGFVMATIFDFSYLVCCVRLVLD